MLLGSEHLLGADRAHYAMPGLFYQAGLFFQMEIKIVSKIHPQTQEDDRVEDSETKIRFF